MMHGRLVTLITLWGLGRSVSKPPFIFLPRPSDFPTRTTPRRPPPPHIVQLDMEEGDIIHVVVEQNGGYGGAGRAE